MIQTRLHPLLALAAASLLISCSSTEEEPSTDPLALPAEEQELAYVPTYSRSVVSGWPKGRALDPHDISRVRLGEEVHTYHVGRLPSHDRREMHEAHTVYRVEQLPRWDTRLPATPMTSRGVVLGVVEPSRNEVPKTTLIEQERQSLVAKSRQLETTMARLSTIQKDLEKKRAEFAVAEEQMQEIRAQLSENMQKRAEAEAELNEAREKLAEMKEAERYRLRINEPSPGAAKKKP